MLSCRRKKKLNKDARRFWKLIDIRKRQEKELRDMEYGSDSFDAPRDDLDERLDCAIANDK